MKAIVVRTFGAPEVLRVEDRPDPVAGPGELLVGVRAVGVNPVDTYIRSGAYARKPDLPYTPHADLSGVVEGVGSGVTGFGAGDRVYAHSVDGAAAERVLCQPWQMQRLPDRVSFAQGAALGVPYGTAWRALLLKARARPGETVLVHGASGGVGTAAVQIARAQGMRVIGTAGTPEGLRMVQEQGAHHVLDHRDPAALAQVSGLTDGRGADVILEMLANLNLDRDLDVLARFGRIVVIGNRGRVEIDPRKLMSRDGAILGLTLFNADREELREIHAGIAAGLESGALSPVVGREFALADAPAAHAAVLEPGAFGKIVLVP